MTKKATLRARLLTLSLALLLLLSTGACGADKTGVITDYSLRTNWMLRPTKATMDVDVFYLYPTAWARESETAPTLCPVDDPGMRERAQLVAEYQATAFQTHGNLYAPYYRQVDAPYLLALSPEEQDRIMRETPAEDCLAAFDYYIKNYNKGRPFLLAGHSQGSNVLLYLLSDYMKDHPEVYKKMIAAYVVGYSVTEDYLAKNPHLRFATGATDTGVIISYNTEAPGLSASNPVLLPGAKSINPINWRLDETPASAQENLGSRIPGADGTSQDLLGLADATVNLSRGVVECSTVDIDQWSNSAAALFPKGVYHSSDYAFYYYNLRQNAGDRIAAYRENR